MSKKLDGFNIEQSQAILADNKHDILISAGAGSGKTKTLTERVYRLINENLIAPSELLVLTFTNNAAHEMKERIIDRFKVSGSPLAEKMPSAHIQTFDSFSQYLVTTYAGRLGVSNRIAVANESSIKAQRSQIVDDVLQRYYDDEELKKKLLSTLIKFNTRDDDRTKKVILDLWKNLEKMIPSARESFISDYDERFLSENRFYELLEEYIGKMKEEIIISLYEAYFLQQEYDVLKAEEIDQKKISEIFSSKKYFDFDYHSLIFSNKKCQALYDISLNLLSLKGKEFLNKLREVVSDRAALHSLYKNDVDKDEESYEVARDVFLSLRHPYHDEKTIVHEGCSLPENIEDFYALTISFKDDIHLLFDIVKECDERLLEYKKSINAFTFQDIAVMALSLISDPKYEDIAKEIRGRFKYIMVDEYQDTNDFQETFINSLLTPDEKGNRAHLFCVGDAKQSIYAFRDSNVALFKARQKLYENDGKNEVIHMNKNYRSGEELLKQINYIFSAYMTLENGSIDYKDPKEQLTYDNDVDIYGEPYDHFGIYRIVPKKKGKDKIASDTEIVAIIELIQRMVNEGHPIYDRSLKPDKIRPCRYSDFAILTRKKRSFSDYQKMFNEAGIPLNIVVSANLKEIDSIILIESLLSLIAWRGFGEKIDVKHIFASVARSYAFQYDDERIYDLISYKDNEDKWGLALIKEDPLMKKIDSFVEEHRTSSFNSIFLDLIDEFGVISNLNQIGGIDEGISKIESLHKLILDQEKGGEGLLEFLKLMKNIKKYSLDLDAEDEYAIENSVDLMTIHASKGLERKIIILPSSETSLAMGGKAGPDYAFSREYGVLLPNYIAPEGGKAPEYALAYRLYKAANKGNSDDMDEHVRLLYVALTRAENAIYIVGSENKEIKGSVYQMLDSMPHFELYNPELVNDMIKLGVVQKETFNKYMELASASQNVVLPLTKEDLGEEKYKVYQSLAKDFFKELLKERTEAAFKNIYLKIYQHFFEQAKKNHETDLDYMARLYWAYEYPEEKIDDFNGLLASYERMWEENHSFDEEYEDEEYEDEEPKLSEDILKEMVIDFAKALFEENWEALGLSISKENQKKEENVKYIIAERYLLAYVLVEGYDCVAKTSYESSLYPDHNEECDPKEKTHEAQEIGYIDLSPKQINDEKIDFPIREKHRASKISPYDDDTPIQEILDRGIHLHRLMELLDWESLDTSYIKDPSEREMVEKVINLPFIKSLEGGEYKPEYGYYDEDYATTGFIDLLAIKDGVYYIIDWKSKEIDDPAYDNQLHTYQRNVMRIFGVGKESIRLVLVSIEDASIREVEPE